MSLQINAENRVRDWPNPYRIENITLALIAIASFAAGIAVLFHARDGFVPENAKGLLLPLSIAVLLLSGSIAMTARAMDQLRKNAIDYVAPKDPVSNLLYALVRNIVYAPLQLQLIARHQFRNFMATAMIAASFALSLFLMGATPYANWLGAIYGVITFYWLIRSLRSGQTAVAKIGNDMTSSFSTRKQLVNVENLTLSIWSAQIETVAFGLDTERIIGAIVGDKNAADHLFDGLRRFADQQSMLIAPNSHADLSRAQAIGSLEQALKNPATSALPPQSDGQLPN